MTMNLEEKFLKIKNKKFKYVSLGEGPLVILVHGWPETLYSWRHQIKFIAKLGFKVVAFNTRGYADSYSPINISEYSMKNFVNDLLGIIDFFNYKNAVLIGHDWGAPICWNTAALQKKKVSAVIGMSVPYTRRGKVSSLKLWQKLYKNKFFYQNYFQKKELPEKELEENISETILKIYYWCSGQGFKDNIKTSKDINSNLLDNITLPKNKLFWLDDNYLLKSIEEFNKSGFRGSINRYRAQDIDWKELYILDDLNVTQPSMFIGGEYDPVRYFIKDYDAFKHSGKYCDDLKISYIVPKVGHWVQQESPEIVNNLIKDFLKQINLV